MPDFARTETIDKVVARNLMVGTLQPYFNYGISSGCGLPSVTLLGEREDWLTLRDRLYKISTWHKEESKKFADQLENVLDYFVSSFDMPTNSEIIRFWNKTVHYGYGRSGTRYLSGWLSYFCFWSEEGEEIRDFSKLGLRIINSKRIPQGFASVPVQVNNNGEMYSIKILAGSVGHRITGSGDLLDRSGSYRSGGQPQTVLDSVQPVVGFWIYEHEEPSTDIEE